MQYQSSPKYINWIFIYVIPYTKKVNTQFSNIIKKHLLVLNFFYCTNLNIVLKFDSHCSYSNKRKRARKTLWLNKFQIQIKLIYHPFEHILLFTFVGHKIKFCERYDFLMRFSENFMFYEIIYLISVTGNLGEISFFFDFISQTLTCLIYRISGINEIDGLNMEPYFKWYIYSSRIFYETTLTLVDISGRENFIKTSFGISKPDAEQQMLLKTLHRILFQLTTI